jgi:hypothetical protein
VTGRRRPRAILTLALWGVVAVSCTGGLRSLPTTVVTESPSNPAPAVPPPVPDPLCPVLPSPSPPPAAEGSLAPEIAQLADQVQGLRELTFEHPVVPETQSPAQLERTLQDQLASSFPVDEAARQQRTLITMGALPAGTDLRQAVIDYGSSEIVGFYDTVAKRLVIQAGAVLRPFQRWVLAHELTHAVDDQHFDLSRLDALNRICSDDRAQAFLSIAEGDAVAIQVQWASRYLSAGEFQQLQNEAASFPPPPETPPFVENLFLFPYVTGQPFVQALQDRGGEQAVDDAFRTPPVSTEQILHPDAYPSDVPRTVAIEDLSSTLGPGWSLADQQEVGEGFLQILLKLRLSDQDAEDAASGWDGGLLRTWANGDRAAVLMRTVWDTEGDAGGFTSAMRDWLDAEQAEVRQDGEGVDVLFGSDRASLEALQAALG